MKEKEIKEIKEISDMIIGIPITRIKERRYEDGIEIGFINPKSINNNRIIDEEIERLEISNKIYQSRKTRENNILIKTTSPFDMVLIDKKHENLMYNSFCINITITDKMFDERYVFAYLNTRFIKEKLENKAKSYKTTPISKRDIEEIKIPYIEKEKQELIGELYINTLEKEEIYTKLIKNEKQITETIIIEEIKRQINLN